MSGIAGSEVFLLIIIGLIVLGPKRLPQVANQLGTWLGQARRMTRMMKRQLEDEINLDLDQFSGGVDLGKQLGLDQSATSKPDVSKPSFVHDKKPAADTDADTADTPADTPAEVAAEAATEEEKPELPDDYSPAHGPEEVGTGVHDDYQDDVPDPVAETAAEPVEEPVDKTA